MRILAIAGLLACIFGVVMLRGTESRIEYKALPPALLLTFTDLPAKWSVETTTDFTNWTSIIHSGDVPPLTLTFTLTNHGQAQFYRVVSRE